MNNVWVYWQGDRQPYIDLCIDTIKKHSIGLNFTLLNDYKVKSYLCLPSIYNTLSVVHRADYIRVALLKEYGGIWLDADTIVLKPLVKYLSFLKKYKFLGFGKSRTPQTAVIAGTTDSLILSLWLRYIHNHINNDKISWGDLGPLALKKILTTLPTMSNLEYYNISTEHCVPISCKDWKDFFSFRKVEGDTITDSTGIVMLYNRYMRYTLKKYDKGYLMNSGMFISKLFRLALKERG